jgi:hypothetical protein
MKLTISIAAMLLLGCVERRELPRRQEQSRIYVVDRVLVRDIGHVALIQVDDKQYLLTEYGSFAQHIPGEISHDD